MTRTSGARRFAGMLNRLLEPAGLELRRAESGPRAEELPRLRSFARACALAEEAPGAVVECGVGRGDSLRLLGWLMPDRQLIGYDSFRGFPPPGREDASPRQPREGEWAVRTERVERRLRRAGLRAHLVSGWFEVTLRRHTEPIAVLHVDADLYASTREAIHQLWPLVVPRGVAIFDDYGSAKWPGVQKAVDEAFGGQRIHKAGTLAWVHKPRAGGAL